MPVYVVVLMTELPGSVVVVVAVVVGGPSLAGKYTTCVSVLVNESSL